MLSRNNIKSAFESMLFVWGEPLESRDAASVFNIENKEASEIFDELAMEYEREDRGIRIRKIEDSYQMVTKAENEEFIRRLATPVKVKRLSHSALEVLAIVAYKQPVTRAEIDGIRGIKSDRVLDGLVNRGLVCEKGRSEGIGRPILFGTTDEFLRKFNITDVSELPEIEFTEDEEKIDNDGEVQQISITEIPQQKNDLL